MKKYYKANRDTLYKKFSYAKVSFLLLQKKQFFRTQQEKERIDYKNEQCRKK